MPPAAIIPIKGAPLITLKVSMHFLEFEKPIAELETQIEKLRYIDETGDMSIADDIARLRQKLERELKNTYSRITPAQKVQVARHPERPHALDYINALMEDYTPLAGDRLYGEDEAIVGGLARFRGQPIVVIGQERGHDTETRLKHNFGMAKPDGYRKAQRLMHLAARFNLPIVTLVDTAGAFPGVDAEARGQAEAIAKSIEVCLNVPVPLVSTVIGEGGSGGAIAIATGDRVLMLEHAIYSVISPEGCASILWRSPSHAADAATALKITAQDLLKLGVIDEIVPEPLGGAHRARLPMINLLGDRIEMHLQELMRKNGADLLRHRRDKFLAIGSKGL